jgi:hypothetical protein
LKNLKFGQKSPCKVWANEVTIPEEFNIIKKKLNILYQANRKYLSRTSQELAMPPPIQAQRYEKVN